MTSEQILTSVENQVFEIQINRPEKLNALTDQMYASLVASLQAAEKEPNVKVILLRSSGAHFSSGNDLKDFLETDFNLESNVIQFLKTMAGLTKPIIAAVNGAAVGIGTTMLLHCDLVYAAKDLKSSVPFIKLSLTPEGASSQLLAKRCGELKANEWLMTGRTVLADEALSSGLVNLVYEDEQALWDGARATAEKLAKSSKEVLLATKKLLKGDQIEAVLSLIDKEALVFEQQLNSDEAKAAFKAFLGG